VTGQAANHGQAPDDQRTQVRRRATAAPVDPELRGRPIELLPRGMPKPGEIRRPRRRDRRPDACRPGTAPLTVAPSCHGVAGGLFRYCLSRPPNSAAPPGSRTQAGPPETPSRRGRRRGSSSCCSGARGPSSTGRGSNRPSERHIWRRSCLKGCSAPCDSSRKGKRSGRCPSKSCPCTGGVSGNGTENRRKGL
jgi:hypothetical protein